MAILSVKFETILESEPISLNLMLELELFLSANLSHLFYIMNFGS